MRFLRKQTIRAGFLSVLSVLAILTFSQTPSSSDQYYNLADSLVNAGNYKEAAEMYLLCVEAEREIPDHNLERISECLNNIGVCYYFTSQYMKAINSYEDALEVDREMGNQENIATCLNNIGLVYKKLGFYDKAIEYYLEALKLDEEQQNDTNIAIQLNNIGIIYDRWGKYDEAIEYYIRSLRIKENLGEQKGMAATLNNIGMVYTSWRKFEQAIQNFEEALKIMTMLDNEGEMAKYLNNLGLAYYNLRLYDTAIKYYNQALEIDTKLGKQDQVATQYNNIGLVYLSTRKYVEADHYLDLAIDIYRALKLQADEATVLSNKANVHKELGNYSVALKYLTQSTLLAEKLKLREQLKTNYKNYSEIYRETGDYLKSLDYYQKYQAIEDSMYSEEVHKQITDFEIKYESEKKDKEIKLLKQNEIIHNLAIKKQRILRNSFIIGFLLVLILAIVIFMSLRQKVRDNRIIENEKSKSDKLLLNILPAKVAGELKEKGKTIPEHFDNVTVYFSDFIGFTEMSKRLPPEVLINELNELFTAFDNIVEKNQCERIKTIGDAYLAVCGLPKENPHHAENIIRSSIEIKDYLNRRNQHAEIKWKIRSGIHTGSVIAGVIGIKKYIYDVFGDTINIASRMESNSESMRINVSEATYRLAKHLFTFEDRGQIEVKGIGKLSMYFLKV